MTFLNSEYLFFMAVPALILFYFIVTNKSKLDLFFDSEILKKLRYDNNTLGRVGRNIMLFIALFSMIIALARPVMEKESVKIKSKSIDLMAALDISKSMLANDMYPNRFAFAKLKFFELLDSFKEANIGVVGFSSNGFLVSPMTKDLTTVKYLVKNLSLDSISTGGTDLFIPIEKAKEFLKDSKNKILIIFTDGGDGKNFEKEIERAKDIGLSVYIYAIGSKEGSSINDHGEILKDEAGNIVISKLNENIKNLSLETGGAYIVGSFKDESIKLLVEDIKNKFKMKRVEDKEVKEYKELFYYPLGLALIFLMIGFSSLPRFRTHGIVLLIVLFYSVPSYAGLLDFLDIKKADEAYKNGDFNSSSELYKRITSSKKNAESYYNLANSQYKEKKYKEALKNYERVSTKNQNIEYQKLFNMGNSYFSLKQYEKALKLYEKAKKIKTEEDLEDNIELAKKMLEKKEEQKKQKQKNQDQKEKQDQKNKKDKKEQQKNQDKKKSEDKKSDEKQQQKDGKKSEDKEKQEQKDVESKAKDQKISNMEERKWEKVLEKKKPKTMPMQFQIQMEKKKQDEKPW